MMNFKSIKKSIAVTLAAMVLSLPMAGQALAAPSEGLPSAGSIAKVEYSHNRGQVVHRSDNNGNHKGQVIHRTSNNGNHKGQVIRRTGNHKGQVIHRTGHNEKHHPVVHRSSAPHRYPAPPPPHRRDRGDHYHSGTGNFITGAIVGTIIGAIIANNNARDY